MPKPKHAESSLRALALDPLRNFKHQAVTVAEWLDAKVIVRALSAGDWLEYRRRAVELVDQVRPIEGRGRHGQGGQPVHQRGRPRAVER